MFWFAWCVGSGCGRLGYNSTDDNTAPVGSDDGSSGAGGTAPDGGGTIGSSTTVGGSGGSGSGGATTTAGGAGAGGTSSSGGSAGVGGATTASTGGAGGAGIAGIGGNPPDGSAPCTTCGPVLYWKFDESGGSVAVDASGNGLDGAYIGAPNGPARSTLIPPVVFTNSASRQFVTAKDQAVELASAPAILKPTNNLTMAVWYRAPALDTFGGEVLSLGENYSLLLRRSPATIELSKAQPGGTTWVRCVATVPNYLDGNWHHLAGVISPSGMTIHFDGAQVATSPDGTDIAYPLGTSLFAGRPGNGATGFSFNGNMDDVRIYTRALSTTEIALLAQGLP